MKPAPPKDLWEQLDAIRQKNLPPEGAFSTREYADRYGLDINGAYREVKRLCSSGLAKPIGSFNGHNYFSLVN